MAPLLILIATARSLRSDTEEEEEEEEEEICCLLVLDSVSSTPQCIRQPRPRVYLQEGT
jgi:hypothetical protein